MGCTSSSLIALVGSFIGAHEDPDGSNIAKRVDAAIGTKCVRAGSWINIVGLDWCARFASGMSWLCTGSVLNAIRWSADGYKRGESPLPFSMRAAVSELHADAVASGAWRPRSSGYVPSPGDLALFKRGGHDPTAGGLGHVAILKSFTGPMYVTIGGNEFNSVKQTDRDLSHEVDGNECVGWIASGIAQSRPIVGPIPQVQNATVSVGMAAAIVAGAALGWGAVRYVSGS